MLFEKYAVKGKVFKMSKENIEADQEHHDEKHEEEQTTSIDNEVEEVEISELEGEEQEKTFDELKEENKDLSYKMMRALAETENIRKKFFKI